MESTKENNSIKSEQEIRLTDLEANLNKLRVLVETYCDTKIADDPKGWRVLATNAKYHSPEEVFNPQYSVWSDWGGENEIPFYRGVEYYRDSGEILFTTGDPDKRNLFEQLPPFSFIEIKLSDDSELSIGNLSLNATPSNIPPDIRFLYKINKGIESIKVFRGKELLSTPNNEFLQPNLTEIRRIASITIQSANEFLEGILNNQFHLTVMGNTKQIPFDRKDIPEETTSLGGVINLIASAENIGGSENFSKATDHLLSNPKGPVFLVNYLLVQDSENR